MWITRYELCTPFYSATSEKCEKEKEMCERKRKWTGRKKEQERWTNTVETEREED